MKISYKKTSCEGFTLVEVLITILIITILAAISLGGLQFAQNAQKNRQAEIQIALLSKAIEEYKIDKGDYPGGANAGGSDGKIQSNTLYMALYHNGSISADGSETIYLSELDPANDQQKWIKGSGTSSTITDPWGEEYLYRRGAGALNPDFDLWSKGKDLETTGDGTSSKDKDDIRNF